MATKQNLKVTKQNLIEDYVTSYDLLLNQAKSASKVYRGFRYYTFGETWFCHENDTACEYPFHRVCVDLPDPQKYIDDNIACLTRELKEEIPVMLQTDMKSLKKTVKESYARLNHLKALQSMLKM